MTPGILAFIIVDAVILLLVVAAVLDSRGRLLSFKVTQPGVDVRAVVKLAQEEHPNIGEYMRTSWDNTPERLPETLESLLQQLDEKARARGLILNRTTLKAMVSSSLATHGTVPARELRKAMERVV